MGIEAMSERIYESSDFTELYLATVYCDIDFQFEKLLKDKYNIDTILKAENDHPEPYEYSDAKFIGPDGKPISLGLAINIALEALTPGYGHINDETSNDEKSNVMNNNKIEIYTDGAAPNNQTLKKSDPVSWAYIIKGLTPIDIEKSKVYTGRSNNDMELSSFIEVMKYLEQHYPDTLSGYDIDVFSDSNYLVNNYNHYLDRWKTNDWKKSDNKPLINLDKWKEIYRLKSAFSESKLSLIHVSGHKNNVGNNRADELANEAIDTFIAKRTNVREDLENECIDFEELNKLRNEYIDLIDKLENSDKNYSKEYHSKNDKRMKNIIIFLEELLGTRLEVNYNLQIDNNYTYNDMIYYYPRFDDRIVIKYIKKISENGINQTAQEWLNSNYHQKLISIYQANYGKDSNSHNSVLKIVSEIRRIKFTEDNIGFVDDFKNDNELEFLYAALNDDSLINAFEYNGLEKAAYDYYIEKNPTKTNNDSVDTNDDDLPF